jgi:hypothetical protein
MPKLLRARAPQDKAEEQKVHKLARAALTLQAIGLCVLG